MGKPIWLGRILLNTVYDQFHGKLLWVADELVKLDGIRLNAGYIYLTIQRYEKITGIYGSYLVYRLYCDNPLQVQIHTKVVHIMISTTQIYRTAERHTFARNKSLSPSDLLYGNEL